jgi:hypothetical protein
MQRGYKRSAVLPSVEVLTKDKFVLSSERAPHKDKTVSVKQE